VNKRIEYHAAMAMSLKRQIAERLARLPNGSMVTVPGRGKYQLDKVIRPDGVNAFDEILRACNGMNLSELYAFRDLLGPVPALDPSVTNLVEIITPLSNLFRGVDQLTHDDRVLREANAMTRRDEASLMRRIRKSASHIDEDHKVVYDTLLPKTRDKLTKRQPVEKYMWELDNARQFPYFTDKKHELPEPESPPPAKRRPTKTAVPPAPAREPTPMYESEDEPQQPAAPPPPRTTPEWRQPTGFVAPPAPPGEPAPMNVSEDEAPEPSTVQGDIILNGYRATRTNLETQIADKEAEQKEIEEDNEADLAAVKRNPNNEAAKARVTKATADIERLTTEISALKRKLRQITRMMKATKHSMEEKNEPYTESQLQ
jgi:hypothetical protein